jgi:hypothetical protein
MLGGENPTFTEGKREEWGTGKFSQLQNENGI